MKFVVANVNPSLHSADEKARRLFEDIDAQLMERECTSEEEVIAFAGAADAITTTRTPASRKIIEKLLRCKVIARFGSGIDNIDQEAATQHGIMVVNVLNFCTEEVANHAMMFILACSKRLVQLDKYVRSGQWDIDNPCAMELIAENTLGLIGFGGIGRLVAQKARGFGMKILAYDPYVEERIFVQHQVVATDLNRLLKDSDYISLHTPLTTGTEKLLGSEQLRIMKSSAYLINCSRGGVVDEQALVDALQRKTIAGAALDCLSAEPPRKDNPLFRMDNVIITPHTAAYSKHAIEYLRGKVFAQVAEVLTGGIPEFVCNRRVLEKVQLS